MARSRRDTEAGVFHITGHSVWASRLYDDDHDRLDYLRELTRVIAELGWRCLAYCLMTNHVHLLLEVDEGTLPSGMQALNTRYACRFNQRKKLRGHVFGGRYGSNRIDTPDYLLAAFAYIVNNPIEAGLCSSPLDWPWSSYAATVGLAEPPSFLARERLLSLVGPHREAAMRSLRSIAERP